MRRHATVVNVGSKHLLLLMIRVLVVLVSANATAAIERIHVHLILRILLVCNRFYAQHLHLLLHLLYLLALGIHYQRLLIKRPLLLLTYL